MSGIYSHILIFCAKSKQGLLFFKASQNKNTQNKIEY